MNKELNSKKYLQTVEEANKEAFEEATALLKEAGENKYIALEYDEGNDVDGFWATSHNDIPLWIFGVGLNNDGSICITGFVTNVGYGFADEDFPRGWVDIKELEQSCYPQFYHYVVEHLDRTISKEEADKRIEDYWTEYDSE